MKRRWRSYTQYLHYFLLTLFVLFLPFIFAETETVFEDSVEEEGTFELDDQTYTVHEYADYTGVRISSNTYGSIIIEEEGDSSTKGPYTFTLDSITQDGNDVTFEISVEKEQASVSVEREASNSTASIGNEITITVTISNDGDDSLTVKYAEDMPSHVSVSGTPEITVGSTTSSQKSTVADVYWKGVLYSGKSAVIVYTAYIGGYPSNTTTISFDDVDFTYEDDTGEFSETVDSLDIELLDPLAIAFTQVTDDDDIKVGGEVEFYVTLTNNLDKTMTVSSFLLTLSEYLTPSTLDTYLEETADGYTWSGELAPFEDLSFGLYVTPEAGGTHTLEGNADYAYGASDETYSTSGDGSFSIDVSDVVPEIKLSSETFDGGEEIIIYYYVNNSDESVSYSSVGIKISSDPSDLFDSINYVASLPKKTKTLIKKQNFTAPYTDTAMEYTVTMAGDLGAAGTFEDSETVTINPSTFTVPYALSYTVDGYDETYTNVTLVISLLTTLAEQPTRLAVVHTADPDYKKTVSLTTDAIAALFAGESQTRSWSIPAAGFTEESIDLTIQLQYDLASGVYYKSLSETVPIYQKVEEVVEETNTTESNETETSSGNETISVDAEGIDAEETAAVNDTETNTTGTNVVITGEKEQTSNKFFWFVVILLSLAALFGGGYFLFLKKQKEEGIKKSIESMTKTGLEAEKKSISFLEKAKEIIIHDVPTPEEGYEKLESYLRHALSQGKTHEEIKKVLAAKGWLEEILDSYLQRLK